jgi:RNA polymerase sigma-70 factor (ECF subfamily)
VELEDEFRRHQREIYLYLVKVTGDRALAEDLAQDTFLRAFQGALTFRGQATVRTWLFAIARNVLISHQRRKRPPETEWVIEPSLDAPRYADLPASIGGYDTLARLPMPAREALVLSDLLGFAPHEAAELVVSTPTRFVSDYTEREPSSGRFTVMSDQQPIDLRDDVEPDPGDLVGPAAKRFRRRVIRGPRAFRTGIH